MRLHPDDISAIATELADQLRTFPDITQRWVGIREAAKFADLSPDRLRKLAQDGHIIGYKDPDHKLNRWTFELSSIQAYKMQPITQRDDINNKVLDFLKGKGK